MLYTPLTKKALLISFNAHKEQLDKSGIPYVYHPYEVACRLTTEAEVCVALLHDVVEDTNITVEDLKAAGFYDEIIDAIKLMTHDKNIPYFEYVKKIAANPIAKAVKKADLIHNSTASRLNEVTEKDLQRISKYKTALELLDDSDN